MEQQQSWEARPSAARGSDGARARLIWDESSGREWRVWAADCTGVPGSQSRECLIFDCRTTVRRVWSPPVNWHRLSDDELLALAERRP